MQLVIEGQSRVMVVAAWWLFGVVMWRSVVVVLVVMGAVVAVAQVLVVSQPSEEVVVKQVEAGLPLSLDVVEVVLFLLMEEAEWRLVFLQLDYWQLGDQHLVLILAKAAGSVAFDLP